MSTKLITDLAETFDRLGPWAVTAAFLIATVALARHVALLYRRIDRIHEGHRTELASVNEAHRVSVANIHEAHRVALAKLNEQHHTTATNALRDLSELVKESTTAMVEMRHSIEARE